MAYAKRLYVTFEDHKATEWTVEIYQDGYGGSASEMVMGADPVSIRWGGNEWKNIIGSECKLSIIDQRPTSGTLTTGNIYKIGTYVSGDDFTNVGAASNATGVVFTASGTTPTDWSNGSTIIDEDFSWLNTANGLEIKIIIKKAASDWWTGFALPNQYYDTLNYPRVFTLTASDRLGKLQDFQYTDSSGFPYDGYHNCIDTLARALSKTGLELDLRSAVNLFEDGMSEGATDDPLDQASIWQDVVQDIELNAGNAYDVVNIICKTFKARLFQSDNEWWIVRIPEYANASVTYRGYVYDNVNTEYDYSYNNTLTPAKATGANFKLLRGAQIESIEPWKQLTIKKDLGKKDTIIKGSTFPKNEFDGGVPRHFTISGTSNWTQKIVGDTYGIICDTFSGALDTNKSIVSDGVVVETTSEQFTFTFKGGWYNKVGYGYLRIWLDTGGVGYWYDGNSWETTAQTIATQTNPFFQIPVIDSYSQPGQVEMNIDGIPGGGTLYVYFYDPNTASTAVSLYIESFSISLAVTSNNFAESEDEITTIDSDNEILAEYGTRLNDQVNLYNNNSVIYGSVVKVGSSEAEEWHEKGAPGTVKTLSEWLADMTIADAAKPLLKFRGEIYGQADFFNTIELTEYGSELFAWDDVEYNIKRARWSGSAVNLKGAMLSASGTSTEAKTASRVVGAASNVTINNITQGDTIPLTTDGDLLYYDTIHTRLPIGTNAQVLAVSSGLPAWVDPASAAQLNNNTWFLSKDHLGNDYNVFKVATDDTIYFGGPVGISSLLVEPDSGVVTVADMGVTAGSTYGTEMGFQFIVGGSMLKFSADADGAGGLVATPTLKIDGVAVGADYSGLADNTIPFYDSASTNLVDSALTDDGTDLKSSQPFTLEYDANFTEVKLHNTGTGGRNISIFAGKTATPTYGANFVVYDNDAATHLFIYDATGFNIPSGDQYRIAGANIITPSASFDDTDDVLGASMKGIKDYGDANWAGGTGTSSNTEVLWNNAGTVDGIASITYNGTDLNIADNVDLNFGAGVDLKIYSTGSIGTLSVPSSQRLNIVDADGDSLATFISNGAFSLYHNNVLVLNSVATGIEVTSNLTTNGWISSSGPIGVVSGQQFQYNSTDMMVAAGSTQVYGAIKYVGTALQTAGMFNGSTTNPTNTNRLNYEGYFYAKKVYTLSSGSPVELTGAGGGSPGGSTTQIQYNNAGSFGGLSTLTTNGTNLTLNGGNFNIQDSDQLQFGDAGATDAYITWNATTLQVRSSNYHYLTNIAGTTLFNTNSTGVNIPTGKTYQINGTSIFATANTWTANQRFNDGNRLYFGTSYDNYIVGDSTPEMGFYMNGSLDMTLKTTGLDVVGFVEGDSIRSDSYLRLLEITTPSATTNYGKVYTKSDNKLYFQDGAGTEHEVALVAP